MKHLARATLTLAVLALLAAIWQPYGPWWAWLLTGVLLLFVGAALGGQTPAEQREKPTGNSTGPHIHITPTRVTDHDVETYRAQHGIPQYGRKANDQ